MQLNKGLNLDIHPSEVKTGEFRYASNISLDSSFRNPINEKGLRLIAGVTDITTLAGVIPYDKGIIVFANTNYIYNINTQVSPEVITKSIHIPQIEFLPTKPIRGTYTYNENKDLIIVFSSGVNGNFEDKIINITKCPIGFEASDYYLLDINPNVQFPNITSELTSGTLLSGSYQICVSYKVDKEYTNHSLLSLPVYIYGTEEGGDGGRDGLSPNQLTSKGIKYTLNNLDTHYTKYRLSVIYNDGTTFIVYDSPDILTSTSEYIIDNLVAFTKSSLDDKLINSIFYSNSESLTVMNNRTYRANLKSHAYNSTFDTIAQNLAKNIKLELHSTPIEDFSNIKSKQYIKFQNDEVYALYLTLGDKKGNVIGSYPINTSDVNGLNIIGAPNNIEFTFDFDNRILTVISEVEATTNIEVTVKLRYGMPAIISYETLIIQIGNTTASTNTGAKVPIEITNVENNPNIKSYGVFEIPKEKDIYSLIDSDNCKYSTNYIKAILPNISNYDSDFLDKIGFWCIHRALRTNTNSKIYTQGISCAQVNQAFDFRATGGAGDASDNPLAFAYATPETIDVNEGLGGTDKHGWINAYTYFNKKNAAHLTSFRFYSFEDLYSKNDSFPLSEYDIIGKYDYNMLLNDSGIKNLYNSNNEKIYTKNNPILNQNLIEGNNLNILNLGLETTRLIEISPISPFSQNPYFHSDANYIERTKLHRLNIYNGNTEYYKYIYDETLVLCSNINTLNNDTTIAVGDTFYSEFVLILKRYDIPFKKLYEFATIEEHFKYISDVNTLNNNSLKKYTLKTFIESKYNIHARYWEGNYPEWDQPISTSEQIGYNKVYNLQNTSNVTTIVDVNNNEERESNKGEYPSRIIMSKTKSQESNALNFRKYLALDYYDMPYNRNAIVALNATYKNLYIQQELALSIASIKDVISYEDGTTYVGSGQLFDRQPTEVIPTGYGFLGCENYFNTGITDLGLWVIDNVQSIIALITDEGINIISNGNNQNWFNNKLRGNNPFINEGCFITYDNSDKQLKRLILTIHQENKTISYIPAIKNWFSFHSYIPRFGVYTRNDTYYFFDRVISEVTNNKLFKYSNTLKSKFSDLSNINESVLSIYFNEDKGLKKLFQSLYWQTQFILSETDIYDKTFTKLFIHNDSQCTKEVTIGNNAEWFDSDNGVYKEDLWIFNGFKDYVKDNRKPFIDDSINIISSNFNYSKEWFDISKFMSIFAVVTFKFDNWYYSIDGKTKSLQPTVLNIEQPKLILNDITMAYKKSIR